MFLSACWSSHHSWQRKFVSKVTFLSSFFLCCLFDTGLCVDSMLFVVFVLTPCCLLFLCWLYVVCCFCVDSVVCCFSLTLTNISLQQGNTSELPAEGESSTQRQRMVCNSAKVTAWLQPHQTYHATPHHTTPPLDSWIVNPNNSACALYMYIKTFSFFLSCVDYFLFLSVSLTQTWIILALGSHIMLARCVE